MNGEMPVNTIMISQARMRELEYIEQHYAKIVQDAVSALTNCQNACIPPLGNTAAAVKRTRDAKQSSNSPVLQPRMTRP
jgi:hypothetical protein